MDDLDSSQFDADTNGFSLIDASASDDDFLLSSSSECNAADNQGAFFTQAAHVENPSDFLAVQRPRKHGKCNLRKSLAWDSAFFTSAGVLDAEELSNIMEGAETAPNQDHLLPGIQEELSKSTDSISTFQSDNLTLESLEADLFCDIRASIQRSSKSSTSGNSTREKESANECSSKISQPSVGNMVKPKISSKKLNPAVQGPARMLKPSSSDKQVTKPAVKGREPSSKLPRPPAAIGKPRMEGSPQSKRMSVSASCAKSEINIGRNTNGAGQGPLLSKVPSQIGSRNTLQKAPASSILSASSVSNKTGTRSSRPSCDSSSSSSSENIRKSLSDVIRRKIDKNANLPPGSKVRTPSRVPVKSKSRPGESQLSAYVKSTSDLSPSISPVSSVSEWSTESSSSTATINQKHGSLKPCSTSEGVTLDSNGCQNMRKHSNDRSVDRHDYQVAGIPGQSVKQPPTGSSVSRPGPAKPSGLRLPSPKIGFFDGAKAGTKTPSSAARPRSALPSNLPRSVAGNCSSSGPAIKVKPGSHAVRVSTSAVSAAKLDPQKSHGSPKLTKELQDHSMDLPSAAKLHPKRSHASPKLTKELQDHSMDLPSAAKLHPKKSHASPKLAKERQDHSMDFPSGSDSGAISEVSKPTSAKSASERNSTVGKAVDGGKHVSEFDLDAKNHLCGLPKDSVALKVNEGSEIFIELPKSTTTKAALEENGRVSEEGDGGEHFAEVSFKSEDHSEVAQKLSSDQEFDVIEVAEATKGGEHPDDCGLASKDKEDLNSGKGKVEIVENICAEDQVEKEVEFKGNTCAEDQVEKEVEIEVKTCAGNKVEELDKQVETSDHTTHVMIEPQVSVEPEMVESHSSTILLCPEQFPGHKQNESAQSTLCSPLLPDMRISRVEESEKHVETSDHDVMIESQLSSGSESILETEESNSSTILSCPEELPGYKQNESAEDVVCSPMLPDLTVSHEEKSEKHVEASDNKTDVMIEPQISVDSETILKNEESHTATTLSCPEELPGFKHSESAQSVMCSPLLPDMRVSQVEESQKDVEASDNKTDVMIEPQTSVEPQTILKNDESHSSTILICPEELPGYKQTETVESDTCFPLSPDLGLGQGTQTPFAEKNLVRDAVEVSNSTPVSVPEGLLKVDDMPSLETNQKENS